MARPMKGADRAGDVCGQCERPLGEGSVTGRNFVNNEPTVWTHWECTNRKDTRETRPCETCGWVRRVTVRWSWDSKDSWSGAWMSECDACQAETSARRHARAHHRMTAKAAAIRAKRVKS